MEESIAGPVSPAQVTVFVSVISAIAGLLTTLVAATALSAKARRRKGAETWHAAAKASLLESDKAILSSLHRSTVAKLVAYDAVPAIKFVRPLVMSTVLLLVAFCTSVCFANKISSSLAADGNWLSSLGNSWYVPLILLVALALASTTSEQFLLMASSRRRIELEYLDAKNPISLGSQQKRILRPSLVPGVPLAVLNLILNAVIFVTALLNEPVRSDPVTVTILVVEFGLIAGISPAIYSEFLADGPHHTGRVGQWVHPR